MTVPDKMRFYVNEESFSLAATMGLPEKYVRELRKYASLEYLTRNNINAILDKLLPDKSKYKKHRKSILEATAIAAYQKGALRHLSSLLLMMRHSSS